MLLVADRGICGGGTKLCCLLAACQPARGCCCCPKRLAAPAALLQRRQLREGGFGVRDVTRVLAPRNCTAEEAVGSAGRISQPFEGAWGFLLSQLLGRGADGCEHVWVFGKGLTCGIQKGIKRIRDLKVMSSQSGFSNSLPPPGYPFYQVSCRYVVSYIALSVLWHMKL